jgi:hypothetical protein
VHQQFDSGVKVMARMRFRLATLLILFTFFAITVGLGYQIYLLKQQVAQLNREVTLLKNYPVKPLQVVFPKQSQPSRNSPFRLLNTETIVNPAIEDGMKAGEWELKKRLQERSQTDDIQSPAKPTRNFEGRIRPLSQ